MLIRMEKNQKFFRCNYRNRFPKIESYELPQNGSTL